MSQDRTDNDFAQGEDPDIVAGNGPDPELGAPGGDDSTVGTTPEGGVSDPDTSDPDTSSDTDDVRLTDETGEFGPAVDRDTGANVGDTGTPSVGQ